MNERMYRMLSCRTRQSQAVLRTRRHRWWEMQCQILQWLRLLLHASPSVSPTTTTSNPQWPCHFLTLTLATEPITSCSVAAGAEPLACIDDPAGQSASSYPTQHHSLFSLPSLFTLYQDEQTVHRTLGWTGRKLDSCWKKVRKLTKNCEILGGGNFVRENWFTSHLGLHQCLVALCVYACYMIKYHIANRILGRRSATNREISGTLTVPGEWSPVLISQPFLCQLSEASAVSTCRCELWSYISINTTALDLYAILLTMLYRWRVIEDTLSCNCKSLH